MVTYAWLALTVIAFSIVHWIGLVPRRVPYEAGRYLFEHSTADDRIFVWGQASKIYLDARRRPASRYVETFPLNGYIFGGHFLVLIRATESFRARGTNSNRILPSIRLHTSSTFTPSQARFIPCNSFPILAKLLADHYKPVAQTEEGVIYYRNDYRPLVHRNPESNR
jgi:hypothetical protein